MKKVITLLLLVCATHLISAQTVVGLWNFNGNANDSTANNLNGIVYNATLTAGKAGIPNTAYKFNGYSSHIDVPYNAVLNLTKFTMEAVVRVDGFSSANCQSEYMLCRGSQFGTDYYSFGFNDNEYDNSCGVYSPNYNQFFSGVGGNTTSTLSPSTAYIQLGTWYDVIATYDGTYERHYINGVLIDSLLFPNQFNYSSTTPILSFGYSPLGGTAYPYWLNGALDKIEIWDNALSSTTIAENNDSLSFVQMTDTVICAGSSNQYSVLATIKGPYPAGDSLIVQLSDATGSFTNPTNLGSSVFGGPSTTPMQSRVISFYMPVSTPPGSGYRLRVVSSNPQLVSNIGPYSITINSPVAPTVSIAYANSPANGYFCSGDPVTFLATVSNAVQNPDYQWRKNGHPIGTNSSTYTDVALLNSDVITCVMTTNYPCAATSQVISNAITVTILPSTTLPVITVVANPATPVCAGTPITFTANCIPGYNYQWVINGLPIANAFSCTFTDANPFPGDTVVCIITNRLGSQPCVLPGGSTTIVPDIIPPPPATVTATGPVNVCSGDSIVLQAQAGSNLSYQWMDNGNNITGAGNTFTAHASGNYSVQVTDNYGCTAASPVVAATVFPPPNAAIANVGGYLQICTNDSLLLGATFGNHAGYTYQWLLNGSILPGATSYHYATHTAGDYSLVVSNSGCINTSTPLTVTTVPAPVDTFITPTIAVICPGTSTVISLAGGTPGSAETYQWYMTGLPVAGATSASYTATIPTTYTLKITDNTNGCSAYSERAIIAAGTTPVPVINYQWPAFKTGTFRTYQWYYNGAVVKGATAMSYTPTKTGVYTVLVTDANGCSGMSANFYFAYSGVNNVLTSSDVKIYPNPTNSIIYIEATATVNVALYTIDGREVFSGNNAKQIDISGLANGLYMIRITDEEHRVVKVEKLVKE